MGPRVCGEGGERRGGSVGGSSGGAAGRLGAPDHSHSVGWGSYLSFFFWYRGCNGKDFFIGNNESNISSLCLSVKGGHPFHEFYRIYVDK